MKACVAEPPSSDSPWAPLQARNAKKDRPTSARPILPAHFAGTWSLARPVAPLTAHLPAVDRQDLMRPDTISSRQSMNANILDADLAREMSHASIKIEKEASRISKESSFSCDLSQQWLHSVENEARTIEPSGPKNLTRFLVSQRRREEEETRAGLLNSSGGIEQRSSPVGGSPVASPRRLARDESLSPSKMRFRWHNLIEHLPFVASLSVDARKQMHREIQAHTYSAGDRCLS